MSRSIFDRETRDGAEYRADRLERERHRLHRRLTWAAHRSDQQAVAWLEKRLEKLEAELATDTAPGRAPGRHDRHRILER